MDDANHNDATDATIEENFLCFQLAPATE